ncbi:MAG: hypothetical protein U0640_12995 [Phycisphaerales bacterium]
MQQAPITSPNQQRFPCKQCGAKLEFAPGQDALKCPYCNTVNEIKASHDVAEEDLQEYLAKLENAKPHEVVTSVHCDACGADVNLPPNVTSLACTFCGSNIVARQNECSVIKPQALLPFKLPREQATDGYRKWIKGRFWAPGKLKRQAMLDESLKGVYLPHWTFDAFATTQYRGMRGDAYWETQYVTVNGQRQARQVRKIRWSPAAGTVTNNFDDVLIAASNTLNKEKVDELTPWDLNELVEYKDDYLAGFRAERYQTTLPDAFKQARGRMEPVIVMTIRQDIGGDEQRIEWKQTRWSDLTFKHILLPIWVSAYRFRGKVYQFMVNARTGEVQGDYPLSWVKIFFAILLGLIVIGIIIAIAANK